VRTTEKRPVRVGWALAMALCVLAMPAGAPAATPDTVEWQGTAEQKLWGLMQVWAEAKYSFAFFSRVPQLDWDAAVQAAIPRVLAAPDLKAYYDVLAELVALLNDGHTIVRPPKTLLAALEQPPIELETMDGKVLITRVGDNEEVRARAVRAGLEVTAVDGVPVRRFLADHALRYYRGGTAQWGNAFGLVGLLDGPRGSTVRLAVRELAGTEREVTLTRNATLSDGTVFVNRIRDFSTLVETRMVDGDIAYVRLATFEDEKVVSEFAAALERLDLPKLRGLILDVRYNIGGESSVGYGVIAHLTDIPLETSRWKTRMLVAADRAWGKPEAWFEGQPGVITPAPGRVYTGPLVVLTWHDTLSSAEDFLVPLDYAHRAVLVGGTTAGSTGQPMVVGLPGGGRLLVCAKHDSYPDGREFVGSGIEPEVKVEPTQADVAAGRDVILEKGLEVIRNWPAYRPARSAR
jgi:carboxyl-terminal processing protease